MVSPLSRAARCRPSGGLNGGAAGGGFFALAAGQGLFKAAAAAGLTDNAIKLHLAVEPLEHALEAFIIFRSNFSQEKITPSQLG